MIRIISLGLMTLAAVTGFVAAWYWLQASKLPLEPAWGAVEPGDAEDAHMGWTAGMMKAFIDSAELNKKAARWTAASVAIASTAGMLALFA